jgi:hypothetical protein
VTPSDDIATNQHADAPRPQPPDPPHQPDTARRARDPDRPNPLSALDEGDLLHPLFTDDLLATMMSALPSPERETVDQTTQRVTAAIIAIRSFDAQEPIEAMLATHVVLAHHAAMACYRRAVQANQPPALASRLFSNAANLSRTMTGALRSLDQRQARSTPPSSGDPSRCHR